MACNPNSASAVAVGSTTRGLRGGSTSSTAEQALIATSHVIEAAWSVTARPHASASAMS
ncbi:MAG: hypothetical protein ABW188_10385 [Rhodococcus fascians]